QQLVFDGNNYHDYMWHAARAFFEEGGTRLYVSRVFEPLESPGDNENADGRALVTIPYTGGSLQIQARFPGDAGKMGVRMTLEAGENVMAVERVSTAGGTVLRPRAKGLFEYDIVALDFGGSPSNFVFATAEPHFSTDLGEDTWQFRTADNT